MAAVIACALSAKISVAQLTRHVPSFDAPDAMSEACQKPGKLTCDLGGKKKSAKNGFLASLKCGRSGPVLSCGNAAEGLLAGRSRVGQDSNLARKRSATQGLAMCIDKPRDDLRVSSSPDSVADSAEMPPKPRNRRRRRRPKPPRSAPASDASKSSAAVPAAATSICIARSPTNKDFIFRVDSSAPVSVQDAKKKPVEPQSAAARSPPYVNSAIAFILGGNEDLSDTASDWDDVDGDAEDVSDFCDLLVMPLLTNILSVSVLSSCPIVQRRLGDQVDGHQPLSPLVQDANDRWNRSYHGSVAKAERTPTKVKFPADDGLVEVHRADDLERKGPWEQIALDRRRFQSRISSVESVLAPVLSPDHRQKIYQKIHVSATD